MSTAALDAGSTLVLGQTTCLSSLRGDIFPEGLLGVYDTDVRFISALELLVDGEQVPLLSSGRTGPSSEEFVMIGALDQYANGKVVIRRHRTLTAGTITEGFEVHALQNNCELQLELRVECDGASILALKGGAVHPQAGTWRGVAAHSETGALLCTLSMSGGAQFIVDAGSARIVWHVDAGPGSVWIGQWAAVAATALTPERTVHLPRLDVTATDHRWVPAISSATADLEALVMHVPTADGMRQHRIIGAGAPWYMAMFGRDAILAAWESLPLGTELALDVLDTLAAYQGTIDDAKRLETPGKIMHERRIGKPQVFGMASGSTYYGSVDATPLFVVLLAEAYRWGAPASHVTTLLPAARRAMNWCIDVATKLGSIPSSPFLWYKSDAEGLGNQAWKDSGDCMVHSDGTLATGPLAVCEVQGYYYDALVGLARLEADLGHADQAAALLATASTLRSAFAEAFVAEDGLIALALDADLKPLQVATSNMGQCLWSGILEPDMARLVADRVMQPDLLCEWGVRTLGSREIAYNPLGYHLGTVWAHDSALVAAGMARHGFVDHARTLIDVILNAAVSFDWRLPELYGGLDTGTGRPVPYPAACSPQAWSAGAPLLLLRAALGLNVDVPTSTFSVNSLLREGETLQVAGMFAGQQKFDVRVLGAVAEVLVRPTPSTEV
jgi:N-terminal domain of (some) glycogen debranching enzymes